MPSLHPFPPRSFFVSFNYGLEIVRKDQPLQFVAIFRFVPLCCRMKKKEDTFIALSLPLSLPLTLLRAYLTASCLSIIVYNNKNHPRRAIVIIINNIINNMYKWNCRNVINHNRND